jgi:phospholipid transport system substrate-binding protein
MLRFASLVFAAFACLALTVGVAPAATNTPEATIHDFYGTLLEVMKRGPELGERGRYDLLMPTIRRDFDLPVMAHMAVGLGWTRFSPNQQQRVTDAFARYTAATYAGNFNSYSGEALQVTGGRRTSYGPIVDSRIVQSNGKPVSINYLMRQNGDHWQIADVYLTGTVSQVATLRAQFLAVLEQRGVDGLVDTLNRKAAMLVASSSAS